MAVDADQYRKIIGSFATGVTVVTTNVDGMLHAFTANAVTSVSLDPILLLVCVDKGARALEELGKATAFGVSILGESQESVSNVFATRGEPAEGTLRGVSFRIGTTGAPLLDGAIAQLECEMAEHIEGGDHIVVMGKAVEGAILTEEAPLLFYQGKYRKIDAGSS